MTRNLLQIVRTAGFAALLFAACLVPVWPGTAVAQEPSDPAGGYHRGAIFRLGLGGAAAINHPDGAAAYGGYAGLGYWFHPAVALSAEFRGYAGPAKGKESFSLVSYSLRSDWCARELLFSRDLCLVAGPSWAQVGGRQGGNGHDEFGSIYGISTRLARFDFEGGKWWVELDLEATGTSVFTGPEKFTLAGAMLSFWFRTDAGVVGTDDTY